MNNIWVQILGLLLGGAGLYRLVEAVYSKRKFRADAADVLTESVTSWAKDLKTEAAEARERADQLNDALDLSRDKVSDLSIKVRRLSYELDVAFAKLTRWKQAIADVDGVPRTQLIDMTERDYPTVNNNGGK